MTHGGMNEHTHLGETSMKRFTFFAGLLLLSSAVAVPFLLRMKGKGAGDNTEENARYDINDYMASEGL